MTTTVFKVLQIISGVDFGFFTYKTFPIKCLVNLTSVAIFVGLSSVTIIKIYQHENVLSFCHYASYIFQYLAYIFCYLRIGRDVSLNGCFTVFENVDAKLNSSSSLRNLEIKNLIVVSLCVMCRILWTSIYCSYFRICLAGLWEDLYYFWFLTLHDILKAINAFVFYLVKCRLVRLVEVIESSDNNSIGSLHRLFKSIVDIAVKIKTAYIPVFAVTLLFNIPLSMLVIYIKVMETKKESSPIWSFSIRGEHVLLVETLMLVFMPAIYAGTWSSYADDIIIILHDKLLEEQDESKAREIHKFIHYVEARPLTFTVFKIIPVDATLPGMVLSFGVTYLIVIIQLTHLD